MSSFFENFFSFKKLVVDGVSQLLPALFANVLAHEHFIGTLAAEYTAGLILLQNNAAALYIDFKGIPLCNAQCVSQFLGDNYTAELVNFSYNTCAFHSFSPFRRSMFFGSAPFPYLTTSLYITFFRLSSIWGLKFEQNR